MHLYFFLSDFRVESDMGNMKDEYTNSLVYVFFSGEKQWHKVSQIKIHINI